MDGALAYVNDQGIAVYRASSISKCIKALVAVRLGYEEMDPPESMQKRFDDGHLHEPAILNAVEAATGCSVYGQQFEVNVEVGTGIIIRGHLDGLMVHPVHGLAVVEAKALSDSGYKKWLKERWLAFPYYADQAAVYMAGAGAECHIMAVKNKNSGDVDILYTFEPPASMARIKARIVKAENLAKRGEIPDCDQKPDNYMCPVRYLHDDNVDAAEIPNASADQSSDGDLAQLLAVSYRGKLLEVEGKALKASVREQIIDALGDQDRASAGGLKVVRGKSKRKSLDRVAIAAAGIDLSPYETETESESITVEEV